MSKFFEEVKQQPEVIRQTILANQAIQPSFEKPLLLTGMGSSLAASELLVAYLNAHGIQGVAIDNSELLYYYSDEFLNKFDVIVTSQSGESYEAKELTKKFSAVTGITNSPGSSVATNAETVYFTKANKEEAIASSKSFTTTVALMLLIGSKMVGKDLSESLLKAADVIEEQLEKANEYMAKIGGFLDPERPLMLLGRGPSVYTARQASLTLKETARMFSEAMSAPQFRHGPFELLEENLQAIFFNPQGKTYEINRNYVLEMAKLGAKVLYVSDEPLAHENIESIVIPSINEYVSVIPYSLVVQLAAVELSNKRGLIAGEAKIISKVTGKE